jgi:hypothetical protein
MAVQLVMRVTRDGDDRLSGTIRMAEGGEACEFSGTLELMRVFEELVPASSADERATGGPPPRSQGHSRP